MISIKGHGDDEIYQGVMLDVGADIGATASRPGGPKPAAVPLRVFLVQVHWEEEPAPMLIEMVALRPEMAIAPARMAAIALWQRRQGVAPKPETVSVGAVEDLQREVRGPYVLVLTRRHRVPLIGFPERIEEEGSANFEAVFDRLSQRDCYGLIMDLAPMTYMSSRGLSVLIKASGEGNLHCLPPRPAIARIFDMVGVGNALRTHDNLAKALVECLL